MNLAKLPKLSIRRMMIGVAMVAAFLPAFRAGERGDFLAGALIVGTCVLILAIKLAGDSIARSRSAGVPISRWLVFQTGVISAATAILLIGSADLFFLLFLNILTSRTHSRPRIDPGELLFGIIGTMLMVRCIGWALRPKSEKAIQPRSPNEQPPDQL